MVASRPYVETLVFLGGISADVRSVVDTQADVDAPVVWASDGDIGTGGRAATAAAGAVRLGRRFVDLVGCVGDDFMGETILSVLKDEGVSLRLVESLASTATGFRQVVTDAKGDRRTVEVANANAHVGTAQVRKADSTIFGADLLFATLEAPLPIVAKVVSTAAARNVPVMLNATACPVSAERLRATKGLFGNVDVLLLNWTEALRLTDMTGTKGPAGVEVCKRLLQLGPKAVVVTMGEHGSMAAARGKHALIEPFSVPVVDTASAGDAYAAAFAVGLTSRSRGNYRWKQLLDAGRYASAAAALCVGQSGGFTTLPQRDAVEQFMSAMNAEAE